MDKKNSAVNRYFDRVYVLNLEKRADRKTEMLQKLGRLNIEAEFVTAVNGYDFQNQLEYQTYLKQPFGAGGQSLETVLKRKLIENPGAWGCLKSYLNILEDAKKNGYYRVLCLEDDAIFHKDFENRFEKAVQKIPQDWKLLYLGASQRVWEIPDGLDYPDKSKTTFDPGAPFYFPKKTNGSFAIGIQSTVYDLLLSEIMKMDSPVDSGPLRAVSDAFPDKCFVINPNLIIADVSDSDIRGKRDQADLSEKLKWNLTDYDYPFQKEKHLVPFYAKNKLFTMRQLNYRDHSNILIEKYKTVFFIIPKTGCTSLKVQLAETLGMAKVEYSPVIHNPVLYPFPFAECDELNSAYREYFKIAIVRNPWSRLVSCYKHKIRPADYNAAARFKNGVAIPLQRFGEMFYGGMSFGAFVDAVCALSDAVADDHFRSQMYQLISPEGELLVNYIGRFETMADTFNEINKKTGLQLTNSVHLNKTKKEKPYREYYNEGLIEKVSKRFSEDIHFLQYKFNTDKVSPIGMIDASWREHFSRSSMLLHIVEEKNRALILEVKKLKTENAGLTKLTKQLKTRERQLEETRRSVSWKITAPLRKIATVFEQKYPKNNFK